MVAHHRSVAIVSAVVGLNALMMLAVSLLMLGRVLLEVVHHGHASASIGAVQPGTVPRSVSLREHVAVVGADKPLGEAGFRGRLARGVAEER